MAAAPTVPAAGAAEVRPAASAAAPTAGEERSHVLHFKRRILVTGGAGFIGSHVVILLVKKYPHYKIVNLDKLDYCSSLKNLEAVAGYPNYTFVKGSIASADLVTYILRKEKIDTIMHFAAQTHVDNSFGNSIAFTESNVLGTHVLLEAAKEAKVKLFVHVSTDEVYGDGISGVASHEGSVLEPTNPYSASKAGAEYLVKAYHRSFALPIIITRGNNVYGPHQYPEKIIPKFVNQLIRGLPITLHGDGCNTRNYLFVEDVARAFDTILHNGKVGETYNIGGGNVHRNIDVARTIMAMLGFTERAGGSMEAAEKRHIVYVADRPFNDLGYPLDCTRLNAIGWKEEVPWELGLRRTVEWYLRHPSHWSAADLEGALVAHPRRGYLSRQVLAGFQAEEDDDGDVITRIINRERASSLTAAADTLFHAGSPSAAAAAGGATAGTAAASSGSAADVGGDLYAGIGGGLGGSGVPLLSACLRALAAPKPSSGSASGTSSGAGDATASAPTASTSATASDGGAAAVAPVASGAATAVVAAASGTGSAPATA